MPYIQLVDTAILDITDEEGIILDTIHGCYFGLNTVAVLMINASNLYESREEVIQYLRRCISADEDTLTMGLTSLRVQLQAYQLLK